jgi:hypothetical protein
MVIRRSVVGSALLFSVFGGQACIGNKVATQKDTSSSDGTAKDTTQAEVAVDSRIPPPEPGVETSPELPPAETLAELATEAWADAGPDTMPPPEAVVDEGVDGSADSGHEVTGTEAGPCTEPPFEAAMLDGKPCTQGQEGYALCELDNPSAVAIGCQQAEWRTAEELSNTGSPDTCSCYPVPCGWDTFACAIPGFVGLDRAGRPRRGGRPLRVATEAAC